MSKSKKVGTPIDACPNCGKAARAVYSQKTQAYTCSRCGHTIALTKRCRRKLMLAKGLYHIVTLGLIFLLFWWLVGVNRILGIFVAIVLIPAAAGLGGQLVPYYFFTHDKFELDV